MFSKLIVIAAAMLVIGVGTAAAKATPQGLYADGLRMQGLADRYAYLQGLKADGLRWQGIARSYQQQVRIDSSAPGFDWSDAGIGAALAAVTLTVGGAALIFVRRSRRTKLAL